MNQIQWNRHKYACTSTFFPKTTFTRNPPKLSGTHPKPIFNRKIGKNDQVPALFFRTANWS